MSNRKKTKQKKGGSETRVVTKKRKIDKDENEDEDLVQTKIYKTDPRRRFDAGVYVGILKDNLRNGHGIMTYEKRSSDINVEKMTYEGEWKNDSRHGKGKMTTSSSIYEGEWKDDVKYGKGKMTYKIGIRIKLEGEWKGNSVGKGKMTFKNGDIYEGGWFVYSFVEGYHNFSNEYGIGKTTFVNGDVYEGEYKHMYDGLNDIIPKGKMTYKNGDIYEGEWDDYQRNGEGEMTYKNGDIYIGEWDDDQMNGYGEMTYKNGDMYEGKWEKGKLNDHGKMSYKNGDIYIGDWEKCIRRGEGRMTYKNEDFYYGEWDDDQRNGYGEMSYKNGDEYEGDWEGDKRDGRNGTLKYVNGDIYIGDWEDDKKNGQGILTYVNGNVDDGTWENDTFIPIYKPSPKPIGNIKRTIQNHISFSSKAHDPSNPFGPEPLIELMKENPDLVAFKFKDTIVTFEKSTLKNLVDVNNPRNSLFYECREANTMIPENIIKEHPLLNLRSISINNGGYIRYEYILDVINGTNRYFLILDANKPRLKAVVSDGVFRHKGSHVSASHCQEGTEGKLFKMSYMDDFELNAARKIQKTYKNYKTKGGKYIKQKSYRNRKSTLASHYRRK
jgi:hypothetical protein